MKVNFMIDLELLRQLREVEGLSHKEIAIRLNKTEKSISHYCSKNNIRKTPKCANKNTCKYCGKGIYYLREYCNQGCFQKHKSIKANERYALESDDIIEKYSNGISMKNIAKEKKIDKKIIKSILENSGFEFKKVTNININTVNNFLSENFKELIAMNLEKEKRSSSNYKYWIDIKCSKCGDIFKAEWANIKRKNKDGTFRFKGCYYCGDRSNSLIRYENCNCCGEKILKQDCLKRGDKDNLRYYCSDKCFKEKESKCCRICNKKFLPKHSNENTCSDKCKKLYLNNIREINFISKEKYCKYCGKKFNTKFKESKVYCSKECINKMNNFRSKIQEGKRADKIKNNGDIDKDITLPKLYEKHKGICMICGEKCDYNDYVKNEKGHFISGGKYPSIDHIIPISKGGTHTWGNVQLACRICNTYKNDSYIEEREGQLRLF